MGLFSIFWLGSENRVNLAARKSLACRAVARAKQPAFARRAPAWQPYALRERRVAMKLAQRLAAGPTRALVATRALLEESEHSSYGTLFRREIEVQAEIRRSEDARSNHRARGRTSLLRFAEIGGGKITRAAKGDCADVTFLARKRLARITTAVGLKHSIGSPAATPSSLATKGRAT
jgi:hypothetical protein